MSEIFYSINAAKNGDDHCCIAYTYDQNGMAYVLDVIFKKANEMNQEYQEITLENFDKVLKFNGFIKTLSEHDNYFALPMVEIWWNNNLSDWIYCETGNRSKISWRKSDFDTFLKLLQTLDIQLNSLPVEKLRPYWEINLMDKDGSYKIYADKVKYDDTGRYFGLGDKLNLISIYWLVYTPKQSLNKESDFTIFTEDGTSYKAIWHGEE